MGKRKKNNANTIPLQVAESEGKARAGSAGLEKRHGGKPSEKSGLSTRKRTRPPVQVFECPSAFPEDRNDVSKHKKGNKIDEPNSSLPGPPILNFHKAAEEVRTLGSTRLQRPQKKRRRDELYEQMTGMKPKGQKMPAKLFMEMQRNRALKERKLEEEARESGLVTLSDKERRRRKKEKERQKFKAKRKNIGFYGPSPDIGFMAHGMYRVQKEP